MMRRRALIAGAAAGLIGTRGWAAADEALSTDAVQVPFAGGGLAGFRAMPARTGPFASVVVIGAAPGMPNWLTALCRRLAGNGYLALGLDVWAGASPPSDDEVMRRLDAAFAMMGAHSGDTKRQALIGFGSGGRVTWLFDARSAALQAAVVWGGVVDGPGSTPLAVAGQLKAPLLALYGQNDPSTPRSTLLKLEAAAGRRAEVVLYDGAGPDFGIEGGPTFDKAAAADGWDKMLAWLKRHGVA